MADPATPKKCAHPICSCPPAPGSDYCSEYCQKAVETEIRCGCPASRMRLAPLATTWRLSDYLLEAAAPLPHGSLAREQQMSGALPRPRVRL